MSSSSFVRKGLEAEHYAVDIAPDGEQALNMALASDYDLLILDLNLPKRWDQCADFGPHQEAFASRSGADRTQPG